MVVGETTVNRVRESKAQQNRLRAQLVCTIFAFENLNLFFLLLLFLLLVFSSCPHTSGVLLCITLLCQVDALRVSLSLSVFLWTAIIFSPWKSSSLYVSAPIFRALAFVVSVRLLLFSRYDRNEKTRYIGGGE